MKSLLRVLFAAVSVAAAFAASASPAWQPVTFGDPVIGKNFYLFDAITRTPDIRQRLQRNPALSALRDARWKRLTEAASSCGLEISCHVKALSWPEAEVETARAALEALSRDPVIASFIGRELRSSGLFYRYHGGSDAELVGRAWKDAAAAVNRIIDVYASGQPPLYPKIDSVSHDVKSIGYGRLIDSVVAVIHDGGGANATFYDPTLEFARRLLEINDRDEAGRFEPLHERENAAALLRARNTDWSRYPYTVILVPGSGPDRSEDPLSAMARLRLEIAAARYRARRAPFILVSGGNVHPNQTRFNEAMEMKRALIAEFGVPPEAIVIEPHARHTTTNLRNAARLLYRYGFPAGKPGLITTDPHQSDYIARADFRDRCIQELGYQPVILGKRISRFDLEFAPAPESLHANAMDPLDP